MEDQEVIEESNVISHMTDEEKLMQGYAAAHLGEIVEIGEQVLEAKKDLQRSLLSKRNLEQRATNFAESLGDYAQVRGWTYDNSPESYGKISQGIMAGTAVNPNEVRGTLARYDEVGEIPEMVEELAELY